MATQHEQKPSLFSAPSDDEAGRTVEGRAAGALMGAAQSLVV